MSTIDEPARDIPLGINPRGGINVNLEPSRDTPIALSLYEPCTEEPGHEHFQLIEDRRSLSAVRTADRGPIAKDGSLADKSSEVIDASRRNLELAKEVERLGSSLVNIASDRDRIRIELKHLRNKYNQKFPPPPRSSRVDPGIESDRIKQLEGHIDRCHVQWERRMEALKASFAVVVEEYESVIRDLTSQGKASTDNEYTLIEGIEYSASLKASNDVLRQRVSDLETRMESMKEYCSTKKPFPPYNKSSSLITQRFLCAEIIDVCGPESERMAATPPLPTDIPLTFTAWTELLHLCATGRNKDDMQVEMSKHDRTPNKVGLVERGIFMNALGGSLEDICKERIADIYGYSDEFVDYKTFLSDLSTRCGVFTMDVEQENGVLRRHICSLMRELNAEMNALEDDEMGPSRLGAIDQDSSDIPLQNYYARSIGRVARNTPTPRKRRASYNNT
jgi:hypothetical protein